ncbi:hypothetical protein KAX08_07255 [candidate division WOR-3 bacterium]|nr:hypothetical protein [candidate division WOR-3 bacterium]
MKYFLICIIIIILTSSYSCQKKHEPLIIERFPTDVGNSWEYQRTQYIVVYDTVNNDTLENCYSGSFNEEFVGIDTMAGWECYRLQHIDFSQYDTVPEVYWYAHPDTALLKIAYMKESKSRVIEESKFNLKYRLGDMYFDSPRDIIEYIRYFRYFQMPLLRADTSYYVPPMKLFIYPLEVGRRWVVFRYPWIEEREVIGVQSIITPAGIFPTLKIKVINLYIEVWFKWIAKEGLMKDSLYFRGEAIGGDGLVYGYYDVYDLYEIVDFELEY